MKKLLDFSYFNEKKYVLLLKAVSILLVMTIFNQSLLLAEPSFLCGKTTLGVQLVSNPLIHSEIKREASRFVDLLVGIRMAFSRGKNAVEVNTALLAMYSSRQENSDIEFVEVERPDDTTLTFTIRIKGVDGDLAGTYETEKLKTPPSGAIVFEDVYDQGDRITIGAGTDKGSYERVLDSVPVRREAIDLLDSPDVKNTRRESSYRPSYRRKEQGKILSIMMIVISTIFLAAMMFTKQLIHDVNSRKELNQWEVKVLEYFYPDHYDKYRIYSPVKTEKTETVEVDPGIDPEYIKGKLYEAGIKGSSAEKYIDIFISAIKIRYDKISPNIVSPDAYDYYGWHSKRGLRDGPYSKRIRDVFDEFGPRIGSFNVLIRTLEDLKVPKSTIDSIIYKAVMVVISDKFDIVNYPSAKAVSSFSEVAKAFINAGIDTDKISEMAWYYFEETSQKEDSEIDAVTASHVEAAGLAKEFFDNYKKRASVPYKYIGHKDFKESMEFLLSLKRYNSVVEYTDDTYPYKDVDNMFFKGALFLSDHHARDYRKALIRRFVSDGHLYMVDCAYSATGNSPGDLERSYITGDPNERVNLKNFMEIFEIINELPLTGDEVRTIMLSVSGNILKINESGRRLSRTRYFIRGARLLAIDWAIRVFTEPQYTGEKIPKRRTEPPAGVVSSRIRFQEYNSYSWFFIEAPRDETRVDITSLDETEQLGVLTSSIDMAGDMVIRRKGGKISTITGTSFWLRDYLDGVAVIPPYILNLPEKDFLEKVRPGDGDHRPFRFPEYIWTFFKEELKKIDEDVYIKVKKNGLGWTDSGGIHFIDEIVDPGTSAKVWEAAKNAIQKAAGNEVSEADIKGTVYYHEDLHKIFSENRRYVDEFRRYLETEVFERKLTGRHEFILAFKRIYGSPGHQDLSGGRDEVDWYLEEFLVLSLQEENLFGKEGVVLDRIGYSQTEYSEGISGGIKDAEEKLLGMFKKRIKYNHKDETALLNSANITLKDVPVNMIVDLSLIPHEGRGLTAAQAELELERNMKNIALLMAWHSFKGFDVRYSFFDREEGAFKGKAMEVLRKEIEGLLTLYDIDTEALLKSIDNPHESNDVITILLEDKNFSERTSELPDKIYPVFLDAENERPGVGIPNYKAAMAIGLSIAVLRIIHDSTDNGRYSSSIKDAYREIKSIYRRNGVDSERFTEDILDSMVTGDPGTRAYLAKVFAFPPLVKLNIEQLRHMHEKLQEVLQAA